MANPLTVNKLVECNDDSLILLGADGVVRIFHYSYSHRLPLWAIVLICVTVLAIVVAVVIFICKRKNKRKEQNKFGKYSSLLEWLSFNIDFYISFCLFELFESIINYYWKWLFNYWLLFNIINAENLKNWELYRTHFQWNIII